MGILKLLNQAARKTRVADGSSWRAVPSTFQGHRGSRSTERAYADVHFVYEIVSRIASSASTLPIKVMQHSGDIKLEATNHPSARLLRKPNSQTPRALLISTTVGDLCLVGNAFWLKVRSADGVVSEVWRLRPSRMTPVPDPRTGMLLGWVHRIGNDTELLLVDDVIHFRNYNPLDDYVGMAPISALRYQVELGRDAEDAAIDLWSNGASTTGVLESTLPLSDDAIDRLAAQFRALGRKGGRYRTPILEEGLTYKPTMMTPKDAEFVSTSKLTRERVAFAYGYPVSDQYSARATPDEIRKALYADAVLPWTVLIEETLELSLMGEWGEEVFPQFQMRHILDPNILERFNAYKAGVYAGWLPPSYVQKLEDIPPNSGPGYIPMNMSEVDEEGHIIPNPNSPGKNSSGGFGGDGSTDGPSTGSGNAKLIPWRAKALKKGVPAQDSDGEVTPLSPTAESETTK